MKTNEIVIMFVTLALVYLIAVNMNVIKQPSWLPEWLKLKAIQEPDSSKWEFVGKTCESCTLFRISYICTNNRVICDNPNGKCLVMKYYSCYPEMYTSNCVLWKEEIYDEYYEGNTNCNSGYVDYIYKSKQTVTPTTTTTTDTYITQNPETPTTIPQPEPPEISGGEILNIIINLFSSIWEWLLNIFK